MNLPLYDLVFRHPDRLWFILPIVIISGVLFWWNYHQTRNMFKENPLLRLHATDACIPTSLFIVRRWVTFSLIGALLVAVWAEPLRRTITNEHVYGGVRIAFLLDVSLSMRYAHDVPPFPDRLVAAKSVLADFAAATVKDRELRGKYTHAIIPFAASARMYLPFTQSYGEFIEAIDSIDETVINAPGTSLLAPILEYEAMLKDYPVKDKDTVDLMILVSDGGKGEGIPLEMPSIKAAFTRMPKSVIPFTVGIGSVKIEQHPDGSSIRRTVAVPLIIKDSTGAFLGYALEEKGNLNSKPLTSELDERTLAEVAGGPERYFFYEGKEQLIGKLKEAILAKRKLVKTIPHEDLRSIAGWFLIPAIILAFSFFGYFSRIALSLRRLVHRSS